MGRKHQCSHCRLPVNLVNHTVIKTNQRTNDATCWPNPWAELAGSRSSHTHQIRSRVQWLSSRWTGPAHPSPQCGGSLCSQAFRHPGHSKRHTTSTSPAFKKLMLSPTVQAILLLVDFYRISYTNHTKRGCALYMRNYLIDVSPQLSTSLCDVVKIGGTLLTSINHQLSPGKTPVHSTPFSTTSKYIQPSSTCHTAFSAQHLRPSGVLSCWLDGLEFSQIFLESSEQHRLF